MNSKGNIALIVVVAAVLLLVLYLVWAGNDDKQKYVWKENYKVKSREPFGCDFIYKLLDNQHPKSLLSDEKPIREVLRDSARFDTGVNYVFIGADMYLNDGDSRAVLDFVGRGNTAFIGSLYFPDRLMEEVYGGECDEWNNYFDDFDTAARLNFFHEGLRTERGYKFTFRVANHATRYNWRGISGNYFCDSSISMAPVGYRDSFYTNFAYMPYGKGRFYMFSTPIVFTNYFMKDTTGLAYADVVFSHLSKGPVIWDEYSKLSSFNDGTGSKSDTSTPLSYILSQKGLRYAWYLLLLGAVLYVVMVARRRQRVVEVIEPNTNTSLAYLNTISNLYFNQQNHISVANHKMKYFINYVRNKYNISLHGGKPEEITALARKSRVPEADVNKIFRLYERIAPLTNIGETTLLEFHKALENFYNQSK